MYSIILNNSYYLIAQIMLCFFLFYTINIILEKIDFFDIPEERKIHDRPITPSGGIGIFFSLIILIFLLNIDDWLNYLIVTSSLIVIIGIIDDKIQLGIKVRIFAQIVSCLIMINLNRYLNNFEEIFGFDFEYANIFGIFFTTICVIAYTNANNFIDGFDGLLGTTNIFIYSIIIFLLYYFGYHNHIIFPLIILISILVFLFFNLNILSLPRIFLGDNGSTLLGFITSWYLIYLNIEFENIFTPTLIIWIIALPMFDFLRVLLSRILRNKNALNPELNHIHHILISLNFKKYSILLIILTMNLFFLIFGYLLQLYIDNKIVIYAIYFIVFLIYYFIFESKTKYIKNY